MITSGLKVVLGLSLALLLTSQIIGRGYLRSVVFFPVLVSTIGVGIISPCSMNPENGMINDALGCFGIAGPGWLTDPNLALYSMRLVDIWKGVGLATVIFMAGLVSIPERVLRGRPDRRRQLAGRCSGNHDAADRGRRPRRSSSSRSSAACGRSTSSGP